MISSDLSWQAHVDYIVKRASKRFFVLCQLVRIGVSAHEIIEVYCSLIRSIVEYASTVWHAGLTKAQSDAVENVQKRSLKIVYSELCYRDALQVAGLELLSTRRELACLKLFKQIKCTDHVLHDLILQKTAGLHATRDTYPYKLPVHKTLRASRSFIAYCIRKNGNVKIIDVQLF